LDERWLAGCLAAGLPACHIMQTQGQPAGKSQSLWQAKSQIAN